MLSWALLFLVIAVATGVFGFGGLALEAAGFAKLLFSIFLISFLVMLVLALVRRPPPG